MHIQRAVHNAIQPPARSDEGVKAAESINTFRYVEEQLFWKCKERHANTDHRARSPKFDNVGSDVTSMLRPRVAKRAPRRQFGVQINFQYYRAQDVFV